MEMKSPRNCPARGCSEGSLVLFSTAGELDDLVYLGHFLFTIEALSSRHYNALSETQWIQIQIGH